MSEIVICGHCGSMELATKQDKEGRYYIECVECECVGDVSDTKDGAMDEWLKGDPDKIEE